jgi:hypothetical protein
MELLEQALLLQDRTWAPLAGLRTSVDESEREDREGCLKSVPFAARAFYHGERTADLGLLAAPALDGGPDVSGAAITVTAVPIPGTNFDINNHLWQLIDPLGHARALPPADTTPATITVNAGLPGRSRLELVERSDSGDASEGATICSIPLSVPQHIAVVAPFTAFEELLAEAGIPQARRVVLWADVVSGAQTVAAHLLRPLNVRLWWNVAPSALPAQFRAHQAGALPGLLSGPEEAFDPDAPEEVIAHGLSAITVAPPGSREILLPYTQWLPHPLDIGLDTAIADAEVPDVGWAFDASGTNRRLGIVRPGLGVRSFTGGAALSGNETDRALAAVTEQARNHSYGPPPIAVTGWWVELNARYIGVCVARAVCKLAGLPAGLSDVAPVVGEDLLQPNPTRPLRQILGLYRPDGRAPIDLPGDLRQQSATPHTHNPETAWTDLKALYDRAWQLHEHPRNTTSQRGGKSTSGYDVLAGLSGSTRLADAERRRQLGPVYAGYELRDGDRDSANHYGGEMRTVSDTGGQNLVEQLQYDLRMVGILLGQDSHGITESGIGNYGYRRWTNNDAKWNGALGEDVVAANDEARRDLLMAGTTGMAVREFQIADSVYPGAAYERLDGAFDQPAAPNGVIHQPPETPEEMDTFRRPYADRLLGIEPETATDLTSEAESVSITGRLNLTSAERLRKWRFTHRRYPIVVEVRGGNVQGPWNQRTILREQLHGPHGFADVAPRMFIRDLSGAFGRGENPARIQLGDYATYTEGGRRWGGPRRLERHSDLQLDAVRVLPDVNNPEDLAVFRIVCAAVRPESLGHLDIMHGYDDAVFSLPLRHMTAALKRGQTRGQIGGFFAWLGTAAGLLDQQRTTQAERDGATAAMADVRSLLFGRFGVRANMPDGNDRTAYLLPRGVEIAGEVSDGALFNLQGAAGNPVAEARQDARYQSVVQWYRSWPWFYRFVMAVNFSPRLQRALYAYEVDFLLRAVESWRPRRNNEEVLVRNESLWDYLTSQRDLAFALRARIRAAGRLISYAEALRDLEAARGDHAQAIRNHLPAIPPVLEQELAVLEQPLTSADRDAIIGGARPPMPRPEPSPQEGWIHADAIEEGVLSPDPEIEYDVLPLYNRVAALNGLVHLVRTANVDVAGTPNNEDAHPTLAQMRSAYERVVVSLAGIDLLEER